ncbi:MAG: 50S ribosomal protein L32, partial [Clostridia bacterium]|nr:50S ribosomal protein L32 [Clostridia bacterium]
MAVPKTKTSKARRDKRRSSVWKLDAPAMAKCPNCGEQNLAYRVCK